MTYTVNVAVEFELVASTRRRPPFHSARVIVTVSVACGGAELTVSTALRLAPPAVAVIVAFPEPAVDTVKDALVAPAGTVTGAGTLAVELELASDTASPPVGAAPESVTVPVELAPEVTADGLRVSAVALGPTATGSSVSVADNVTPPPDTEIVTSVFVFTGEVPMSKPPAAANWGTVTEVRDGYEVGTRGREREGDVGIRRVGGCDSSERAGRAGCGRGVERDGGRRRLRRQGRRRLHARSPPRRSDRLGRVGGNPAGRHRDTSTRDSGGGRYCSGRLPGPQKEGTMADNATIEERRRPSRDSDGAGTASSSRRPLAHVRLANFLAPSHQRRRHAGRSPSGHRQEDGSERLEPSTEVESEQPAG